MRKRIIAISVLLGLVFLTSALSPYIQSASDPIIQHTPTMISETGAADCADAETCPNLIPASQPEDEAESDPDMNEETGNTSSREQSDPENTKSVNSETAGPSENKKPEEEQTDGGESDEKQEDEKEYQKSNSAPSLLKASPVSWHMTFNVDCVSSGCIALSDTSAGMYVSACNDGGGEYRSVEFTPVSQDGKFVSYHISSGDTPNFNFSDVAQISNPSSSFSYGPVAPHNCVTAVFESEFDTPPADHTEYKRFEFRLSADNGTQVQTTSAYADKYGCYAPPSSPRIGIVLKDNNECVEPDADSALYEIRIENTGNSDICGLTLSSDKPGSFRLKNGNVMRSGSNPSDPFVYDGILYMEDYITVIFEEDLSNASLTAGSPHTVNLNATGELCMSKSSAAQASATAKIEICHEPEPPKEPDIKLDITAPAECSDPESDEPDRFTVTVTNTGEDDLCRVSAEGPEGSTVLSVGGESIANGNAVADAGLLKSGESIDIIFAYKPSDLSGSSYTAHFSVKGYVDANGNCTEAVTAESSAEMEICEPEPSVDLDLDLTAPSDCSVPGSLKPDEFHITVTNTGNTALCKVIVSGPAGTVFHMDDVISTGNTLIISELKPGQSAVLSALYLGETSNGSYTVSFNAEGYVTSGIECEEQPSVTRTAEAEVPVCEEETPAIIAEINASDECHIYTGDSTPDRFEYEISNTGDTEFCTVTVIFEVIANGSVVRTETIDVPAESPAPGESLHGFYEVMPEEIAGIQPGDTYSVRITANASVPYDSLVCPSDPVVSAQDEAEKPVCPDIKPVFTVYNLNPACIDAGDTLKFKGLIDIDLHSAAEQITVNTGQITWGGTNYACEITSVKKSVNSDFVNLPADQRGTSYEFTDFGHGTGAVGFICEAKTSDNEQMRNGRGLSFSAIAAVSSAGSIPEYRISSNTAEASQKCEYTHTTLLPYTGDDGTTPILVGMFSLFLICGGASSIVLLKRKRSTMNQAEINK